MAVLTAGDGAAKRPGDERSMTVLSPAKINLFLRVTGQRPDGYHELYTLMCSIGLCDEVRLIFGTGALSVACDHPGVAEDETNLAYRAAALFLRTFGAAEAFQIAITKRIPVAAGLGGGSSNAAAVLMALNRRYGSPFSREQLMALGLSLGADVPFFIFQRPALAEGIGENMSAFEGLAPLPVVLIYPGFGVSTAEVFKNFKMGLTNSSKKFNKNLFKIQKFNVDCHLCNDLETVTAGRYPAIGAAKAALLRHGARGALMSGSGPTVFGLFDTAAKARQAQVMIAAKNAWQVILTNLVC